MSVIDDGQRVGDRPRERIAAAGDERDVDAGGDGIVNRVAVGLRHAARRVSSSVPSTSMPISRIMRSSVSDSACDRCDTIRLR